MLGRTAGSLYWMFRYLERMENTARLVDTGFQIAMTSSAEPEITWGSILTTADVYDAYHMAHSKITQDKVVDFLLRDNSHPYSARSMLDNARNNARAARTALTIEIWEAINQAWLGTNASMKSPIKTRELPKHIRSLLTHSQSVRGALHGTMLRNDIFDFLRLGNYVERLEATARILDVKYYVLLPSIAHVGSNLDNVQWETILRSVSAFETYRWLYQGRVQPSGIANFLIFDERFPRSIRYTVEHNHTHLSNLCRDYGVRSNALALSEELKCYLQDLTIEDVFQIGLHEFLQDMMTRNRNLALQIENDYRFYG